MARKKYEGIILSIRSLFRRLIGILKPYARGTDLTIFRMMVEHSGDVICYVVDGRFTYVSPAAKAIFGWSPPAMMGTDGLSLIHRDDLPILNEVVANRDSGREVGPIRHQLRVICGDGSIKWSETSAHSGLTERGRAHTILVIRDITERKSLEEQLQLLALKDGLTGLSNRRSFDNTLAQSWQETLKQGSEMALLMLDIDHFKRFNDSFGHQAGDDCLRVVAAAISRLVCGPGELACRYGGEEFAVILDGTDLTLALEVGEKIRSAVADLCIPDESNPYGRVTISIGVAAAMARVGGTMRMPESLVQAADHALYKAKANGRNRVEHTILLAPPELE